MTFDGLIFTLVVGAIVLAAIAVVLDRLNFPQRPFNPRQIDVSGPGPHRDRTGAHIETLYEPVEAAETTEDT